MKTKSIQLFLQLNFSFGLVSRLGQLQNLQLECKKCHIFFCLYLTKINISVSMLFYYIFCLNIFLFAGVFSNTISARKFSFCFSTLFLTYRLPDLQYLDSSQCIYTFILACLNYNYFSFEVCRKSNGSQYTLLKLLLKISTI